VDLENKMAEPRRCDTSRITAYAVPALRASTVV
jgi:hypothetical protein